MLRNLFPRVWKLRQRFGIAAPLGISAASAAWIYDAGRRFAGFDRSEVQEELRATRSALEDARAELDRLRAITNASDSRLANERTAQQKLAQQIRALELVVNLTEGGQSAIMSFPEPGDAGAAAFRLAFKYFRRVEGTFRVSPKAKVESVQVRVYELGSSQPRATLSVSL